jgi:membrane protease YdiL (CAAX protease family)
MSKLSTSTKIYIGLVLILAASNTVQILLPSYQSMIPAAGLPAPLPVIALVNAGIAIVLYGGLGFIGLTLARKNAFADIWQPEVTNSQRFLAPGITGVGLGILLIVGDIIFSQFNGIGRFQHPPFPSSIFASLSAGIGEELLFRLFFISLWFWLISLILRGKWQKGVFWIITIISALVFALGHIPSIMIMYNYTSLSQISPVLWIEGILLNGIISVFAAFFMKKYGFLAAAGVHFWTDIVWHVIWGVI